MAAEDARARKRGKKGSGISKAARERRVNKLASQGRASKAMQGLITVGVAADTDKVRGKLGAKFPTRNFDVMLRHIPPPAGAEVEDFVGQVKSFDSTAAPGPSGIRPQFIKELVGEGGDDPCVLAMFELVMLFVEGRAPRFLSQW